MNTQIKFIASGANSAIGGFSPGDIARIDLTLASHLVDVAKVAVYVDASVVEKIVEKPKSKPENVRKTLKRKG